MGDDVVLLVVNNWAWGKTLKDQGVTPFFSPGNVAKLKLHCLQATYVRRVPHWLGVLDNSHNYTNRSLLSWYLAPLDCVKGKGKAVPLQAWSGLGGSRKLRFPGFMTTAQDGGKVVSLTHRPPLPPGNTPGNHLC